MAKYTFTVPGVVTRVVDGDTLEVVKDLGWRITHKDTVRLADIDAPELATPEGKAAKAFVQELLPPGSSVLLHSKELDKYGRSLASVTLCDGSDLATMLRDAGHIKKVEP